MVLLVVAAMALAPNVLLLPLFAWAQWVRRRTAAPRFAPWTAYALLAFGAVITMFGAVSLLAAGGSAGNGDADGASQRSRLLAEGISEAINCGALVVAVAVVTALWLLLGTWRWYWAVRPPVVKGDPPYR